MRKRNIVLIVLIALIAGGIVWFKMNHISGIWRYKMTVIVETPEGIKTGSAVRELRASTSRLKIIDIPESTTPTHATAEAVVVDLGARGKLFATLSDYRGRPDYYKRILYNVFGGGTSFEGIRELNRIAKMSNKVVLTPEKYPMLVYFKDYNDPTTVEPLDYKNFSNAFGDGVFLKEITIEIVDEPITGGIVDQMLPSSFEEKIIKKWREIPREERARLVDLIEFKRKEKR